MGRRRRTPAEKKRLSYERDYRDEFWNTDKGSRKAIGRRKRARVHADRKRASQGFAPGVVPHNIEDGDHLQVELLPAHVRGWWKTPGRPLGQSVLKHLERRASRDFRRIRSCQRDFAVGLVGYSCVSDLEDIAEQAESPEAAVGLMADHVVKLAAEVQRQDPARLLAALRASRYPALQEARDLAELRRCLTAGRRTDRQPL